MKGLMMEALTETKVPVVHHDIPWSWNQVVSLISRREDQVLRCPDWSARLGMSQNWANIRVMNLTSSGGDVVFCGRDRTSVVNTKRNDTNCPNRGTSLVVITATHVQCLMFCRDDETNYVVVPTMCKSRDVIFHRAFGKYQEAHCTIEPWWDPRCVGKTASWTDVTCWNLAATFRTQLLAQVDKYASCSSISKQLIVVVAVECCTTGTSRTWDDMP